MKTSWMTTFRTAIGLSAAASMLMLASCSQIMARDSKKEAKERWNDTRAKLKYQLAAETFNTGQLDEAQKQLDEALALNPASAAGHVLHARILLERGQTAAASAALDEALRNGGDDAETDYLSGMISQRYGKFEDALAWYQRAADRDRMNAPYVVAVAETLVALDRPADALALVRSRLTDFEQNATLRAVAGEIYLMLDRFEEAADAYREAARIAPDDTRVKTQLGLSLTLAGNYQEAEPVLAAVASAKGPDGQPLPPEASVLTALGRCRLTLKRFEPAKESLRQAVEAEPKNSASWSLLARASLGAEDLLTARRAAMQAAQLVPNAENELLLAYVCYAQRDYPASIEAATAALRENPSDSLAIYVLAQAQRASGNLAAAKQSCERVLRENPDCSWARRLASGTAIEARPKTFVRPAMPRQADKSPPQARSLQRP